jgi:hypothetical protein
LSPPPQGEEEEDSDEEEFLAQLPTDAEAAEEAIAEQRAILASFETQRRDQSTQELMAAEGRPAVARLAEEHAAARADAHRGNIEAGRATMAASEQHLFQVDVIGGLATVAAEPINVSISTLFHPSTHRCNERRSATPSPPSSRTPSAAAVRACRRSAIATSGPMTELGRPTLHRHHHRVHREPTPPAGTPMKTSSFSFIYYILLYYVKTIYISIKSM